MSSDAFLILFMILITLMTVMPLFLRRFKIPQVISLLVVGMLIGPNGFAERKDIMPPCDVFRAAERRGISVFTF